MNSKSFYQYILLPIFVTFTLLVGYYAHSIKKDNYNVWHTERETTVTFTYAFLDYYQNSKYYNTLDISRSSSQPVKPGHTYYGYWKITNIGDKTITVYIRHYVFPLDYIKYVRSNTLPDMIVIPAGQQFTLVVKGFIDPSVLTEHDDQPYARSMTNRLELSHMDFEVKDELEKNKKYSGYGNPTPDVSHFKKVMPYKWYLSN